MTATPEHLAGLELALEEMKEHRVAIGGVHLSAISHLEYLIDQAKSAPEPVQVSVVAWMLADAVGGSMLEFQRDLLLENQCRYGGEIVPLYTHPADQVPAGTVQVPVELLERVIRIYDSSLIDAAYWTDMGRDLEELRSLLAKSEGEKP